MSFELEASAVAMEQVASYLCLILAALLLPLLFLKLSRRGGNGGGQRLPPGPSRLPLIGSLHHFLLSRSPLAHRTMADLARRHGAPLMYLRLGEVGLVVASSPAAAREVMRAHDTAFASRPWIPSMRPAMERGAVGLVFARHGPLWRQLRSVSVLELLSARRVRSFRRVREDEARRLVAAVAAAPAPGPGGEAVVNVGELLAALTTDVTVRAVIGDRFDRREEFARAVEEGGRLITRFSLGDLFPSSRLLRFLSRKAGQAMDLHRKMFELMDCAIRQHEERRAAVASAPDGTVKEEDEGILGVLLRIHKEGGLEVPLTMDIVKSLILDLFSGGSDTSGSTLEWAMSELMRNPRAMEKAQAEVRSKLHGKPSVIEDDLRDLNYLKLVIKETLRLHPVLPLLLPRECAEDREVMGYDVPKGATVLVNAWAIGRDPEYWDDADAFKPERFEDGKIDYKGTDFEFIPFGAGRRMCPGTLFAQAVMELALASLLYHFDWKLPGGMKPSELEMTEKMGMAVKRKDDLYLRPVVRVPVPPQSTDSTVSFYTS
ncbi:hypothetical protein SEVIR_7G079400v4 [Setaria viridis]|uniref:Cytochrome P450 n=1 Tax=Setaria viridis TaxID=4556 RepID=A0A4V6D3U6_SETVI|nr:zealexin A1 synthase-like [Setaria viridis]TKW03986.1 hypothetical protein SEVIR_7G079400v2 [Setaria viridis]